MCCLALCLFSPLTPSRLRTVTVLVETTEWEWGEVRAAFILFGMLTTEHPVIAAALWRFRIDLYFSHIFQLFPVITLGCPKLISRQAPQLVYAYSTSSSKACIISVFVTGPRRALETLTTPGVHSGRELWSKTIVAFISTRSFINCLLTMSLHLFLYFKMVNNEQNNTCQAPWP